MKDLKDTERNWNGFWQGETSGKMDPFWENPHPEVVKFRDFVLQGIVSEAPAVLDLGCGLGRNLVPFAEKGFDVYGIDFSEKALEFTRRRLERLHRNPPELYRGDYLHILQNSLAMEFDAILAFDSLLHGRGQDPGLTLGTIAEHLKPEGHLFLALFSARTDISGIGKKVGEYRYEMGKRGQRVVVSFFTEQLIREMLKGSPLELVYLSLCDENYVKEGEKDSVPGSWFMQRGRKS